MAPSEEPEQEPRTPNTNPELNTNPEPGTLNRELRGFMAARLHRWDEIALEKVTEMVSQKIVSGEKEMLAQIYLKRGAQVPMHSHESEQMTYILQGSLRFLVDGEEIVVSEGEVLHIPPFTPHQAEALEDTFELDVFSPIRKDWVSETN
jgi:quercetin dioxygenase-like cupin family protein